MLKLIISANLLIFSINYATATSCYDLQQSQLLSLNERMNKMIDTISALLPTPLKKSTPPVSPTVAPQTDYPPSFPSYESPYYSLPPAYPTSPPTPYLMYVPPPYAPIPTPVAITPPMPPSPIPSPPRYYSPTEVEADHVIPPISHLESQSPRSYYQYEQYPLRQYQHSIPITHRPPPTSPSVPYSYLQPPYLANYNQQYMPEFSYPGLLPPSIPMYSPSHSPIPLPMPIYMPPNSLAPAYPIQPELLPPMYS